MSSWSPSQYLTFEAERTRPVRDLLAGVPTTAVRSAVDIGCGPGNSTEVLAARFPGAAIQGLDSSAEMIAAARQRLPQMQFTQADISSWADPGPFDVILANAVLQWVPDHAALLPRLVGKLAPGGSLAVQVPDGNEEPAHILMREVAADERWAAKLATATRGARESARWYYELLKPLCARVDVWRTIYHHVLPDGAAGVVEWYKGSALRPFLAKLDPAEQPDFLARYQAALATAYPALPDGSVLLPFPRLFIVATR
ncbi:MAG TPA: trans-aconitate 2-methyltransferase [Acetobacteraceae bacterium]